MYDYDAIPTVIQPHNLKIKLFKHQLASIYKMETLEREQMIECGINIKETRLGVNADPTGYGKTLSMIGLICRDSMIWDLDVPFVQEIITTESAGLIRNREINRYDKIPATLILVSQSIISQWEKEFLNSDLQVMIIVTKQDLEKIDVINCDVVLVSTNMFNNLIISFSRLVWKRFIFDEPGHIRVPGMKEIKAGFYWFVTATPDAITSRHHNCHGSFIRKIIGDGWIKFDDQFNDIILKNDIEFVKASFKMPPTYHHEYECHQPILHTVAGIISQKIHVMISAGDIDGAITALGGKKTDNIIELVRKEKLDELVDFDTDIHIYKNIKKNDKKLKDIIEKRNVTVKQLETLTERFKDILNENRCSICHDRLTKPILEPNCQNLFCGKCLLTWLKKKEQCPLCRNIIHNRNLVYFDTNNGNSKNTKYRNVVTKMEIIIKIILNNKEGKFLIFSSSDATFIPICKFLEEEKISFTQLKGTKKILENNIDNFKYGDTRVIFLNSTFNGSGLNLQETTDIILYHEMSSSTKNQIIGRANRIGRTHPLHVHHLKFC